MTAMSASPPSRERAQLRALDRARRAHRHSLQQLFQRDAHVQELGKRRHHVGTRQQEARLVHGRREDVGKKSLLHGGDRDAEPEAMGAMSKIEENAAASVSLRVGFRSPFASITGVPVRRCA